MRFLVFAIFLSIIAWFTVANLFDKIGDLVDKLFINKVKNINKTNNKEEDINE